MERNDNILDTSKLILSGEFEQQVDKIMDFICLRESQVANLIHLFKDLENTFTPEWREVQVMPFGSIVTGLAIQNSDADCFVRLPGWLQPPQRAFVLDAKRMLMRYGHLFREVFAVVNAKVPIVHFYHAPTRVYCDISFKSPAGVHNSKLIRHLIDVHKKVFSLVIIIKYWSKIHNVTGTNLMPSYCLTMLVIFFLQQLEMLPSIHHLQRNVDEYLIDNWNFAFNEPELIYDYSDKSLYKLIGDFFKYYSNFEYNKFIVCPYLGRPIARELFAKDGALPSDYVLYKKNMDKNLKPIRLDTAMCVQDPFEHNRNCAIAVHPKLAHKILTQMQRAANIYENESEGDFLRKLLEDNSLDNSPVVKKQKKKNTQLNGVRKAYRRNYNLNLQNSRQYVRQNRFRGGYQDWR